MPIPENNVQIEAVPEHEVEDSMQKEAETGATKKSMQMETKLQHAAKNVQTETEPQCEEEDSMKSQMSAWCL